MRLPHPVLLLLAGTAIAACLTWIVPAGEFERRDDPAEVPYERWNRFAAVAVGIQVVIGVAAVLWMSVWR